MWIFTTGGFISAVEHRDNDKLTMVRARDKMSLEEFLSSIRKGFVEAGKTEDEAREMVEPWSIYAVAGDYKWRVVVPKSALGVALAYEATHYVNYSNFKSKLTATRGQRWHDTAMKVWSAMFGIEDKIKTGNPDVDNPRPFSSYHNDKGVSYYDKYPAPKGGKGGSHGNAKASLSEGTASGSEDDWMDDAVAAGYYDADEHGAYIAAEEEGRSYRWGGNSLFSEDLEGYDPDADIHSIPSGTGGYHTFSGRDFEIDGRGEIIDGQFIGSTFFDDVNDTPTDAELEAVEQHISESWEQWDEETEFNTVTGETRSKIKDPLFDAAYEFRGMSSVHSMTDEEWKATQLAEGYAEQ
jgi:hypothetical protein